MIYRPGCLPDMARHQRPYGPISPDVCCFSPPWSIKEESKGIELSPGRFFVFDTSIFSLFNDYYLAMNMPGIPVDNFIKESAAMKKKIGALALIFCVLSLSPAFARDHHRGHGGGYRDYRPVHRGHHNDGLGIAFGIAGGLLLGSALLYSVTPPPPPEVVYSPAYPPPSRICFQDQTVTGQWQIDPYNGRRSWMPYAYPVTQRVQIPCY